jgi:hypothetical protein
MATFRGVSAGVLAGGSIGAMGYGYNKTTQGGYEGMSRGIGAGVVGAGIGVGAFKIARGGGKALSDAEVARRGATAIEKSSRRFKKGGLGLGAIGIGGAAYSAHQFQQGDYGQAALGAGVSMAGIAGASGMLGAMSRGNKVSGAIRQSLDAADKAMEGSKKLANRADAFRKPRNFGYGTVAAGALTMAGGIQQGSMGATAVGAGILAVGGGIAAIGRSGVSRNMAKSEKLQRSATRLEREAAGVARTAERYGTRTAGRSASNLRGTTDRALSESVTALRRSSKRTGYAAAGTLALGIGSIAALASQSGIF